jgi:hypothetical protein
MTEWTTETLKQYFDERMTAQREALTTALAAADKAVTKSESLVKRRFDSINEFRNTLADQHRNFVVKSEVDYRFGAIEEKVNSAVAILPDFRGKSQGMNALWIILFSVTSLIISIAAVLWGHYLRTTDTSTKRN